MPLHPATSSKLVAIATIVIIGAAAAALVVMALLVRYTDFIVAHPLRFFFEVVVISIGSALPIYIAAHNRNSEYRIATWHLLLLAAKLAVFWVLMEVSGVNSVLFPPRVEGYTLPPSMRAAASLLLPLGGRGP